jgi:hypothetical protein
MVGTFLYLTVCSLRNRIRVRLRRLKEPRYLIGTIVGGLYLYYFAFYRAFSPGRSGRGGQSPLSAFGGMERILGSLQFAGTCALFVLAAVAWVLPGSRKPIEFSRAEVQFLFQAPLPRRDLLHYKLLRSQLGLIFGSLVATAILRPSTFTASWTFLIGTWLALTLGRLYSIGVSFARESLARHGASGLARQWLPAAIVIGAIGVLGATIALDWQNVGAAADAKSAFYEVQRLLTTGAAGAVLLPFRLVVRLPLALTAPDFLAALPAVLGLIALSYVWVLRADTAFEEASAAQAEKRATTPARARTPTVKTMATPFKLALEGPPETAILWKNLLMVGRYASLKMLFRLAPMVVVLALASRGGRGGVSTLVSMLCLVMTFFTVLVGPQIARNDLRQDLSNLAVLKTWPISGAALIRGEVLAPAVLLTAIAWLCILGGGLLFGSVPIQGYAIVTVMLNRVSYGVAAMIVAPPIILAQLVVQNGAAVMFPAWVATSSTRARGVDAMGQRLLMMAGMLLVLVVSLLPALLVAGVFTFVVAFTTGVTLVVVPALIVAIVMLAESFLATLWLGRVLDRTDVGALGPTE